MRSVAQTLLFLSTGFLPVAYAFSKLQVITGDGVNGCSPDQLNHLMASAMEASDAAHSTGTTLLSATGHSFAAVELLLGGQHYQDLDAKAAFAAAVTNHVLSVASVLRQTLETASELSPRKDTLNFACPLDQEHPIVVGESGTSGIRNVLNMGPSFFKMSPQAKADQSAYDEAKKLSSHSRVFAQMPSFTTAPFHLLRNIAQALMYSLPVPPTPLSLDRLVGSLLKADGYASVCILKKLDEEPFAPCHPTVAGSMPQELPPCPSIGPIAFKRSRVRRTTPTHETPKLSKPGGLGGRRAPLHIPKSARPVITLENAKGVEIQPANDAISSVKGLSKLPPHKPPKITPTISFTPANPAAGRESQA